MLHVRTVLVGRRIKYGKGFVAGCAREVAAGLFQPEGERGHAAHALLL